MRISVCMATYNGGKYLREQMDSILNQDLSAFPDAELEIIVSDDDSTDDTIQILESYCDSRIKIYHHTKQRRHRWKEQSFACTENFGNAMAHATGDYIMLSDQDDVWFPNKMAKTIAELIAGHDMCMVGFDVVTPDLKKIGSVRYEYEPRWRLRRRKKLYGFSCGFTKKELERYLPIPDIAAHDNFMMLVSQFRDDYSIINETLALHRWNGINNVSAQIDDSPYIVRNWYRIKQIVVALWRAFVR